MKKKLLRISFLFIAFLVVKTTQGQTGPAGVGDNTSNALWLKANAGTSTTINGAAVSSWNDVSGNANHVSQTTAVQQPVYTTNVMNGFPAILFDNNNTAGQNDYLTGVDASSLDNTTGFTIFTVTRMTSLGGAQTIIAKRTNVGVNQAYMFFYYTGNFMTVDIASNDDRYTTSPTAYATNTNNLIDLFYDGTLANPRSRVYSAQTLVKSSNETATSLIDYASPLLIGTTHIGDNRSFSGYIAEIIMFREALNTARRIVVDNHLSSKYSIPLASNDFYAGDTPGAGNFDLDVAGIGQFSLTENHQQFSPSVTLGLGLSYKSGFDNGDYLMAGQNLVLPNSNITNDIAVVSGGPITHRWNRIWYLDVTNSGGNIVSDVVFDLSDGGFAGITAGVPSNYKLLFRSTNTGNWTIVSSATLVAGDVITFENIPFSGNTEDGYYTIGTLDNINSSLPVELMDFSAVLNDKQVDIYWVTGSEINNDYFTIEKSKNGTDWIQVAITDGAGSSNQVISYQDMDPNPFSGTSYYRLKQTDFDGRYSYSDIITINNAVDSHGNIIPFPNPVTNNNFNLEFSGFGDEDVLVVVRDIQGKQFYSKVHAVRDHHQIAAIDLEDRLAPGTYLVIASSVDSYVSCKLIVK